MSVKDILVAAFNKDATSFETAFSSVMKEKVSAAVENKFFAAEEYELDESKYEDEEDEYEEDEDEEEDDEDELEEKKLTAKDVKHALASAKAKPKETVSLKKPPFKMDEEAEELDEANQVKMSNLKVGDTVKLSKRFGGKQGIVHKVHKDGADIAYGANSPAFTHQSNFTKINVAKEEVEQIDELSKDTLRSYNDKSKKSSKELGAKLDSAPKDLTGNFRVKDHPTLNKLQNRVRGQRLAHGRLTSEEVELDEVSSKLLRRAAKAADYNHQAQIDMQKEYEPNRKTPAPSVQAANARAMKFRVAALKKDYTTKKEEVNFNEASE